MTLLSTAAVLDVWEAGLLLTPAARAVLLLDAAGGRGVEETTVGERNRRLLEVYGAAVAEADCTGCGARLEVTLDATHLTGTEEHPGTVSVECDGFSVVARIPTADDLARLPAGSTPESAASALLDRCVLECRRSDRAVAPRTLPRSVLAEVEAALEAADACAEISVDVRCTECGSTRCETVDPVRFAWARLETAARHLATDVHTLAHAYGWAEHEVLALSPFRRHLYLSAVRP